MTQQHCKNNKHWASFTRINPCGSIINYCYKSKVSYLLYVIAYNFLFLYEFILTGNCFLLLCNRTARTDLICDDIQLDIPISLDILCHCIWSLLRCKFCKSWSHLWWLSLLHVIFWKFRNCDLKRHIIVDDMYTHATVSLRECSNGLFEQH